MRHFLSFVFIITLSHLFSQISDDFSDGNFTANPVWSGTTGDYQINGSFQLQLNNSIAATSYLSSPHGLATLDNKEWNLFVRHSFASSSSNFGRIYLTSNNSDLTTDPDGFYLQMGEAGTTDAVRLFKVVSGVHTELLAGPIGQISTSFSIGVRVLRDNLSNWSLYIDPTGAENYVLAGTVNDASSLLGTHFGVFGTYTMSNAAGYYYDKIYVGDEILDLTAPNLLSAIAATSTTVDLQFNEAINQSVAENVSNYSITPSIVITSAILDGTDPSIVHLTLASPLSNGQVYDITAINIEDLASNIAGSQTESFGFFVAETPVYGDVIINEFMCDQSPVVGLPEVEFVEIFNSSSKVFDVGGWKLGDASSQGTLGSKWLLPNEYMILTSTSNVDSFTVATAVSSFPSLNNSGDNIVLLSDLGVRLDSISYDLSWYKDATKEDGGYSIERINPNDPCSSNDNWSASTSINGGTPGQQNSIYNNSPDVLSPQIAQLIALSPNYLEIHFNEGMDSLSLSNALISVSPTLTIANNYILEAYPTMVTLEFIENLVPSVSYSITLQNVQDCWMNNTSVTGVFALPEDAVPGDVVINEIVADPFTGGADWIELLNNSDKLIDLYQWEFANYDNDTIANFKTINVHYLLYPNEHVVFGENISQIGQTYPSAVMTNLREMDLPSYNNDSGTVYIQVNNVTIDKVSYSDDWHFKLLDNNDGKSLERRDPKGESNSGSNWHTASETVGFATPGLLNSQYNISDVTGEFEYVSDVVSPDNDGYEDVLQINYTFIQVGNVGTFTVFDDRGRLVSKVINSELLGSKGSFVWDGVTESNTKASIGIYIGVFEVFNVDGGVVLQKRKAFTVAGKL